MLRMMQGFLGKDTFRNAMRVNNNEHYKPRYFYKLTSLLNFMVKELNICYSDTSTHICSVP